MQKAGGQVVRWMNAVDRVFVPGKHEPGLAVARAFGDFDLKSHGLIVNPVVRVHDIKPSDEFAVLCSDGVSTSLCTLFRRCLVTARTGTLASLLAWPSVIDDDLVMAYHASKTSLCLLSGSFAGLGCDVQSRGGRNYSGNKKQVEGCKGCRYEGSPCLEQPTKSQHEGRHLRCCLLLPQII